MRPLAFFLLLFTAALAQVLPPERYGLTFQEQEGAWVYQGPGVRYVYLPGVGWVEPNRPDLPPPSVEGLEVGLLQALGYFQVPEAGVRLGGEPGARRLVLDLKAPYPGPVQKGQGPILLPYLAPGALALEAEGFRVRFLPQGTELVPSRPYRYRLFPLPDPPRLVLDLGLEVQTPLAPGVVYRETALFTPEPLKVYLVEAQRGRLLPVGRPGGRALGRDLAPGALALLNGGYFDGKTATPIGLWVQDGVTLSYPYGRAALLWNRWDFFIGWPRYEALVRGPMGAVRVGLNLLPARYTAYTVSPAGRPGEEVALVVRDRVERIAPAPLELPPGAWALAYPKGSPPFPLALGTPLSLYGRLDPPVDFGLEAGPLLVQEGRYALDPAREAFRDPRPLRALAPQAAVALFRDGRVWLLVSEATTPDRLARGLLEEGVWAALRMDAGGSAQLWVQGALKGPAQPGGPRPVVNGLALYPAQP